MDSHQRRVFQASAAEIGPSGIFRSDHGSLSDFLENVAAETNDPLEIGALILDYFCVESHSRMFNEFFPGVRLALAFLDEAVGQPRHDRSQSLKDLKALLISSVSLDVLREWVRIAYSR